MPPPMSALLILIFVMMVLFISDLVSADLVAAFGLIVLGLLGYVSAEQLFAGFASPVVITIVSTFIIGASLRTTGVADRIASAAVRLGGNTEAGVIAAVMTVGAFFSAFMNNVAATALLLPTVVGIAWRAQIPLSKLMMPLAFAAIFGGTTTLIGSPPNILASDALRQRGYPPFAFLDFTLIGLAITAAGALYVAWFGRRLLPHGRLAHQRGGGAELAKVYQLYDRVFALRIPPGSTLNGKSLSDLNLGSALGIRVLSVGEGGRSIAAPGAASTLRSGDRLVCRGRMPDVESALRFRGVKIRPAPDDLAAEVRSGLREAWAQLIDPAQAGSTLRELNLRRQYGPAAIEIERGGISLTRDFGGEALSLGDRMRVVGTAEQIAALPNKTFLTGAAAELPAGEPRHALSLVSVPPGSELTGMKLGDTRIDEIFGLTILRMIRSGSLRQFDAADAITAGDELLVIGNPAQLAQVSGYGKIEIVNEPLQSELETENMLLVEAVLAPRSKMIGSTLRDLKFRERYDFEALAIWREKRPFRSRIRDIRLEFGDALLLRGPRNKLSLLAEDPDLVLLEDSVGNVQRWSKAPFSIGALILMIALSVAGIVPIAQAAFLGALVVILSGALSIEEAYREIEWKVVVFVGALLPTGMALENSGATGLAVQELSALLHGHGPWTALAVLSLLSSLVAQALDGSVAVIFLAPLAIGLSRELGIQPQPLMMAVALSASICFLTPFSAKANLLVMGVGGYRARDYFRVGLGATIIMFTLVLTLVPVLFPF